MTYTLTPFSQERLLVIPDGPEATRARILAISFGGRWVRARDGYALTPGKAAQFEQFFAAGATAKRAYRAGPIWRYTFPDSRRPCNVYAATRHVKAGLLIT